MNLTAEQQLAVDVRNKNLLVAAAAGSGKTKVLVERIKKLIIDDQIDVDKILVVTFTNAAANEMKSRIHKSLSDSIESQDDLESMQRLERQMLLMSGASIMTMHAFCQSLLRRNFSKINLDPKFRVADEQELNLIRQDVIEDLFEDKFSDGDDHFRKFTDDFGGDERGNENLFNIIFSLYDFSQSFENPIEWLNSLPAMFDLPADAKLSDTIWFKPAIDQIKMMIDSIYLESTFALDVACTSGIYENEIIDDHSRTLTKLVDAAANGDWNEIYNAVTNCEFINLKRINKNISSNIKNFNELKDLIQSCRNEYKDAVKNLREKYFFATEEEMIEDLRSLKSSVEILAQVTIDFSKAFSAAKRDKAIIDFNDMEHLTLEILKDDLTVEALRRKYRVVMVDEYQDTNRVQESIFLKIADTVNKKNFFAVGDVKQSIYKFRLADPSLFMEKFSTYPTTNDDNDCLRIDLSKNFRSRQTVIDSINFVFENLMISKSKKDLSPVIEILYNDEARLNCGFDYPKVNYPTLNTSTEFYLINDKEEIENESSDEEDQKSLAKLERETQLIADQIKNFFADKIQVYDKDLNCYRPIKYSDIVILRRAKKNPKPIMDILKKNNIPAYSIGDETYFQKLEIQIMLSLLTILDNARQDIPLAAVMLSPIGGFTAEDLATLKIYQQREDLFTTLNAAAIRLSGIESIISVDIAVKSKNFLEKINAWRELSRLVSVSELITTIYRETGYYDYVGGLPEGSLRQANLRMLIDRAAAYEATSFRGLSRFLKFVKKIKELKTDLSVARTLGENEDVVRVMSIHKSKGLEFPVVFICELGKKFNVKDETSELVLRHKDFGIGLYRTLNEPLRIPTFARQVISQKNIEELKAEELRILYVAMTRAREKLILIGTNNISQKKLAIYQNDLSVEKISGFSIMNANSFLEWLMMVKVKNDGVIKFKEINASEIRINDESSEPIKEIKADMTKLAKKISTLTSKNIPSKMAVTELKRRLEEEEILTQNLIVDDEEIIYKRPDFEQVKKLSGAEYGTLMHSVMQRLDLESDLSYFGISQQIDRMISEKIFTIEESKIIRKRKIANFFASKIGQRMIQSEEIYRELPFSRLIDASRFFPNVNDKIFIQGIIDVLFRDGDQYILIDYKTDRVEENDPSVEDRMRERYGLQINLYAEAVEAIINKKISEKYLYMLNGEKLIKM